MAPRAAGATVIDHRPHLILPGFIDAHIHFPQVQVIGSWGEQLLDWLNAYVFVEEQKFADPAVAGAMAPRFYDELLRHGTTTAAAFCSVHPASVDAYFAEGAAARHADDRRQGDDGPQRPGGAARHRAAGLRRSRRR